MLLFLLMLLPQETILREFPPPKSVRAFPPPIVTKSESFQIQPKVPLALRQGYPVRGSWWTGCSDWTHLTQSVHAGKFPRNWLQTLTNQEVQSLHSDDHEHRVKWEYVPGGTNKINTITIEASDCILVPIKSICFK